MKQSLRSLTGWLRRFRGQGAPPPAAGPSASGLAEALAAIWSEVLGVPHVGPDDDFFTLGGDSLLATQVVARLRERLGIELPLRALFEHASLARLAAAVAAEATARAERDLPPIRPILRLSDRFPLSFAQQRLWFLERLEPEAGAYNEAQRVRLRGTLDRRALEDGLTEVLRRHEILRTTYQVDGDEPVQVVAPPSPCQLPLIALDTLSREAAELEARRIAAAEIRRPFDLERGPVLRVHLLRLEDTEHELLLVLHHIACDGWSMGVLLRELAALYGARRLDRPSPLSELPIQYVDYTLWQRYWLQGEVLAEELAYWRSRLASSPLPPCELPVDRPRLVVGSRRRGLWPLALPAETAVGVQALGQAANATSFMVLLAAFQALLHRYTAQGDIALGSPIAGRRRVETEGLIGFFVNTLVLRMEIAGSLRFAELVAQAREVTLGAYAHQDLPFEKLVAELRPGRNSGQNPLFQILFVLQNAPLPPPALPGLALDTLPVDAGAAKFDLTLNLAEGWERWAGLVEYAAELFDAATIARLCGHFTRLLAAAVASPDLCVSALPLLSGVEREQILVEWNDTGTAPLPGSCLHELVEAQARRTPEEVALVDGTREILYGELDRRADRLAAHLRRRGAGPEALIGLYVERSAEMVVAVLAILKAGAAYLPLDPQLPRARLESLLTGARAAAVVSGRKLAAGLPWNGPLILVEELDEGPEEPALGSGGPDGDADPDNLAYVLYTSGSTGAPKGVAIAHRSAVEMVRWAGTVYGPEDLAGVLASTSLSFDMSVFELFAPLSHGGRVILARNVLELPALPSSGRVTLINTVPSAISELVREGALDASVRTVNLGGEAFPRSLAERIYAAGQVEHIWNLYGPSEDTTYSTFSRVARTGAAAPNIGRPVAATRAYVLGAGLEPMPAGVAGEMYLSGAGLARGYLHRPDLTAERFIPDPFAAEPGARLYRVGDLVRWTPRGELEFLGRLDHQVKVRGFRVELEEIERALAALTGVSEAVVAVREDAAGDRRLIAYVVGDREPGELRQLLRERLPDYMVPAAFVKLSAIPLNPNGKVDRPALPAPEWGCPEEGRPAPRTLVEEVLAGIWAEVLGLERVGTDDDFFALGGHSLLATRVASRLRRAFGFEMPLRDLFEAPVLAGLAARVEGALRAGTDRPTPPLVPVPREGPLPLSFAQQRLWFIDQLEPGSPLYNIAVARRIGGPLDAAALAFCLGEVARRHETLRTVFATLEGSPVQVVQPTIPFALPVVDLSGLPEMEREELALALAGEEAGRPFDLGHGPLLRGLLLRLADGDHVLALTLHHIASDGWSMGILVREVKELYEAFIQGRPAALPELPVQYADYAVWQRSWLDGEVLDGEVSFWRRQLADLPPRLELPADRRRPATRSFRGDTWPVRLSAELTRRLRTLSRGQGATLFMALLAGFQALLARCSGQLDLAVGSPVSGRNLVEVEGLIGFFVNTLVLRGDLTGGPSFQELLGQVRETSLAAHAHQDVPFEKLVQELSPDRSFAHSPLFQAMLALQNAPAEDLEIHDLRLRPMSRAGATAKFDLTLDLWESDGLTGSLIYSADLFDAATAGRMAEQFLVLLAGAAADPDACLSDLPLLSAAQRQQLILEWNDTEGESAAGSLLERLAARVRSDPEATALLFEPAPPASPQRWTFAELDAEATRLAWYLRTQGVGPEAIVALRLERGPALVAAVLAVLKAGGAYLPLSPSDPPSWISALLAEVRPQVLLTRSDLAAGLTLPPEARLVCLDRHEPAVDRGGPQPLPLGGTGNELAYVLYTSGSTGRPKGVQITHGSLLDYLEWIGGRLAAAGVRRLPWITRLTFDASLKQLFTPLLRGEAVWILPEEAGADPVALLRALGSQQEVGLNCVPSLWQVMVEAMERGDAPIPAGLACLLLGGERLSEDLVARSRQLLPRVQILNLYGPTEATANASWAPVEMDGRVTGGRPLPRHVLRLLDPQLAPVPVGAAGELFVGGSGLARGYLGRPDLTAAAFLPDPWGGLGARMYRTGDLGRFLPDGRLHLQGRADLQIKVRGQRVEIEEIEAVLASHPAVRECCVLLQDGPERPALAAAVVLAGPAAATERELGDFLAQRLPAAMVPVVALLPEPLPRLSSGKIDRRGLARRGVRVRRTDGEAAAPRTAAEEIVAGAFAEVLGIGGVGPRDNFFDLGGHSLLATRVASRLRQAFRVDFPLRTLFETPTVEGLARFLEGSHNGGAPAPIEPLALRERLPLSFAQQRLWFLDQMAPGSSMYNIPYRVELAGPLSRTALERSLAEILRRHEALRTTFPARGGEPYQAIVSGWLPVLPLVDLTALEDAAAEVARLAIEEAERGFDLRTGPLVRFRLLRERGERHHLLCTLHHIVSDGWSMEVLLRELAALYIAFVEGLPSPLPPLPVQYADFAAWQRERWNRGELRGQLDFWRERLAGLPTLELPADGRRSDTETPVAAVWPFTLPSGLVSALAGLSRRQGATRFMSFMAALQALLGRLSGQQSFAVGSPVAGREHPDLEGLIGFFVNTLVLRCDLADNPSFATHLERVRGAALDSYQNQELPFEKLVEELQPERRLGQTPLFQVLFAFHSEPRQMPPTPGLGWEFHQPPATVAKFDLSLVLRGREDLVTGFVEYRADLFSPATVQRLARQFQTLLEGIVAEPGHRLSELPLLTAAERWQIEEWNAAPAVAVAEWTLAERIGEQVRRRPDALAVVFRDRSMTYRELDRRAEGVAARLRELGVGPGTLVALCVERSPELVVGLYGALKAGAAYVPIDPGYPRERMAYLLEDSRAAVLLSRRPLAMVLPDAPDRVVFLDDLGEAEPTSRPRRPFLDGLLYTIYTSGSTGRPKAAGVYQRAFLNLLRWYVEDLGGTADDRYLLLSSFSFDLTQKNIFAPLVTGGRLVLGEEPYDPELLAATIAREGVTRLTCTPSAFYPLLAVGDFARLASLRMVILGGEPIATERLAAWRRSGLCRAEIVNSYGPTECTDVVAYHRLPEDREPAVVPAGRPVPGARLWVADAGMSLVPVGVEGQLWIGGLSVGAGYLRDPALTAAKFRPDPFSDGGTGTRCYATGDRARWLPGGEIEYLGRIDQQVKIRGFRIEPGEVESALRSCPGVTEAVVAATEDQGGDLRLVAYVTAAGEEPPETGELRAFLLSRLPAYMVPSWFVVLRELPLSPNGKVDRRALRLAQDFHSSDPTGFVAPRSLLEQAIADVWARVLGLERVGAFDSFFELGGHSLNATRVVSQLREELGVEVPLRTLFQAPTVADLAVAILKQMAAEAGEDLMATAFSDLGEPVSQAVPNPPGEPR